MRRTVNFKILGDSKCTQRPSRCLGLRSESEHGPQRPQLLYWDTRGTNGFYRFTSPSDGGLTASRNWNFRFSRATYSADLTWITVCRFFKLRVLLILSGLVRRRSLWKTKKFQLSSVS